MTDVAGLSEFGRTTAGYTFDITCGSCDGPLRHTHYEDVLAGRVTRAHATCQDCGRDWRVTVTLVPPRKDLRLLDRPGQR